MYASGDDVSLEGTVGALLRDRGAAVAVAESCTGGLLGQRLTAVAGSSAYFLGGVLAYSNDVKERELGVPHDDLAQHGAVSREVALAMANGVRERFASSHALAVTGVAGPGGGSPEKPVGTVHLAVVGPQGAVLHTRSRFPGNRTTVRRLSTQVALEMLRRMLLGEPMDPLVMGGWNPEG